MALQFPLGADEFAGLFKVRDLDISLSESRELNETTGGDLLTAETGPRLWRGYYELSKVTHRDAARIKGLVSALQYGNRGFMAFDHVMPGLKADPAGAVNAGFSPVIEALNADNQRVKISGVAPGLVFSRGDKFCFVTGSGAIAFHQIVSGDAAAGAGGITPWLQVVPHILPAAGTGDPVTLHRPYFKARIVPESFKPGRPKDLHVEGIRFEFVQQVK